MRVPHVGKVVLLFLIQFGLYGCIQSDKNILSDTDTVTPLPKVFSLVALDKNNGIALDKNDNATEYDFVLTSSSYIQTHSDGKGLNILSFYSIDASNTYLIGLLIKDKATGHIADVGMYTIARLIGDTLTHFEFSNETLIDDLKRAGIEVDERAKYIKVNSKDQLMLVAQLMEKRVNDADESISYRLVASDQQRAKLANDIKVARLNLAASDPEVLFTVGLAFEEGREVSQNNPQGVPQNYAKAAEFYRKAADHGLAKGQYKLGWLYDSGHGVAQNYAEAVVWYRKAAEQGLVEAQNDLGVMYQEGRGVLQDYAEAVKWYRKAAERGDASGQNNLAIALAKGHGVPENDVDAVQWWRKAADQGFVDAQYSLAVMYLKGRGVQQNDVEAAKWFRKAADQGDVNAQYAIGQMFDAGIGVSEDCAEAVNWYRKAADRGHAKAQNALGNIYDKGRCVPQDHGEAVKWWRRAADQGNVDAQAHLANAPAAGNQKVPEPPFRFRPYGDEQVSRSLPQDYAADADFSTNGFTDPALMKEIYEGKFDSQSVPPAPIYAQEFMSMFVHGEQEECKHLVNPSSFAKITAIGTKRMVQDLIPGLNKPTLDMPQQQHPRKLEDFFTQGWNMGSGTMGRANQLTKRADSDAQLFYDRHGCKSEIAQRFFRNLNSWIDLL